MSIRALWKEVERAHARLFGGRRIRIKGMDTPDVVTARLAIESKLTIGLPGYMRGYYEQARANSEAYTKYEKRGIKRIPVVVIHRKGESYREDMCLLKAKDLVRLTRILLA